MQASSLLQGINMGVLQRKMNGDSVAGCEQSNESCSPIATPPEAPASRSRQSDFAVPAVPVDQLHVTMEGSVPCEYPREYRETPLDRWKMEIHDAPIFRYLYRTFRPKRHLEFGT